MFEVWIGSIKLNPVSVSVYMHTSIYIIYVGPIILLWGPTHNANVCVHTHLHTSNHSSTFLAGFQAIFACNLGFLKTAGFCL